MTQLTDPSNLRRRTPVRYVAWLAAFLCLSVVITGTASFGPSVREGKATGGSAPKEVYWLPIAARGESGPANSAVRQILLGPYGGVWIAADKGLIRMGEGELRAIGRRQGLPSEQILGLASTPAGVAVATRAGLVFFDDAAPDAENKATLLSEGVIPSVVFAADRLWFLHTLPGQDTKLASCGLQPNGRPLLPCKTHQGPTRARRLLANQDRLLVLDISQRWSLYDVQSDIIRPAPEFLQADVLATAGPFSLTLGGLVQQVGAEARTVKIEGVEFKDSIGSIALSRDGNRLWLLQGNRLHRLDRAQDGSLRRSETVSVPTGAARAVAEDDLGRLWLGTDGGLLMADPLHLMRLDWPAETGPVPGDSEIGKRPLSAGFTQDGRVFLGGDSKLIALDPDSSRTQTYATDGPVRDAWIGSTDYVVVHPLSVERGGKPTEIQIDAVDYLRELEREKVLGERLLSTYGETTLKQIWNLDNEQISHLERTRKLAEALIKRAGVIDIIDVVGALKNTQDQYALLWIDPSFLIVRPEHIRNEPLIAKSLIDNSSRIIKIRNIDDFENEVLYATRDTQSGEGISLTKRGKLYNTIGRRQLWNPAPVKAGLDPFKPGKLHASQSKTYLQSYAGIWLTMFKGDKTISSESGLGANTSSGWFPLLETTPIRPLAYLTPGNPAFRQAIVNCIACKPQHLFQLSFDGSLASLPTPGIPLDAVGTWYLHDNKGAAWMVTSNQKGVDRLYSLLPGGGKFQPVTLEGTNLGTLNMRVIDSEDGVVVFGAQGMWRGYGASMFAKRIAVNTGHWVQSLGQEGLLFVKSDKHLVQITRAPNEQQFDLDLPSWNQIAPSHYRAIPFFALALKTETLLLHAADLYRINKGKLTPIPLVDRPSDPYWFFIRWLPRLGTVVGVSTNPDHTRLWRRPPGGETFARWMDVSDVLLDAIEVDGKIWFVGSGAQISELRGERRLVPVVNVMQQSNQPSLGSSLLSICPLEGDQVLALAQDRSLHILELGKQPRAVRGALSPWHECVPLGRGEYLLLHGSSVSRIMVRDNQIVVADEPILSGKQHALQLLQMARTPPLSAPRAEDVAILAEGQILLRDPLNRCFVHWVDLPPRLARAPHQLRLAGGRDNFYLGTPDSGLWGIVADPSSGWKRLVPLLDSADGLPSDRIDSIIAEPDGRLTLFTGSGLAEAHAEAGGSWKAEPLVQNHVIGSKVQAAERFPLGRRQVLVLGNDQGLQLIEHEKLDADIQQNGRWSLFNRERGLLSNEVHALAWFASAPEQGHLWVGTDRGVSVLQIGREGGKLSVRVVQSVTEAQGLPSGPVVALRLSEDGRDCWILTQTRRENARQITRYSKAEPTASYRLSRWHVGWADAAPRSERRTVVSSDEILFADVTEIRLGPSLGGRPPQVVFKDKEGNWVLSQPAAYVRAGVQVKNLYAFLSAKPVIESLDPRDEDLSAWSEPKLALDRVDAGILRYFLSPDFWRNESHRVLVRFTRRDALRTLPLLVIGSAETPHLTEVQWGVRLALLVLLALTGIGFLGAYASRILWRRQALRSKAIPYVQGEAIGDPLKFFGRSKLMTHLRDSIATTNYALLGEFRIGKTSIQKQLTRVLKESHHPEFVFFPMFVDLQKLGERGSERFFYFLASSLMQIARDAGIDVASLRYATIKEQFEQYDVQALESDIEQVLSFLAGKTQARRPMLVFQIDEVMLMESLRPDTRLAFRSLFVHHEDIKTVLSGPRLPKDPEVDRLSPWWNFLREMEIGPVTPAEARELIVGPVRGLFRFEEAAIELIAAQSQGRPLLLQNLCADVLRYRYERKTLSRRIRAADVEAVIKLRNEEARAKRTVTRFLPGLPARGRAFYGYREIDRRVLGRGWTWICGQRRMGKTSVLYRLAEAAKDTGKTPLLFDLAVLSSHSASGAELFRSFLSQQIRPQGPLANRGIKIEQFKQEDAAERFRGLIERLLREVGPVLFLWDEAERLIEVEQQDPGFLERLRAQTHTLEGFQFVIAGTQILSKLYGQASHVSPFLQTFSWLPLAGLNETEAACLLRRTQTEGWLTPLSEGVLRELVSFAGGHPLILHECGAHLADESADDGSRIDDAAVKSCMERIVSNTTLLDLVKNDFAKLTTVQQAVLSALCRDLGPLPFADLVQRLGVSSDQIESAIGFLRQYGYLSTDLAGRSVLRFAFYRKMLPSEIGLSVVHAELVERIGQVQSLDAGIGKPTLSSLRDLLQAVLPSESELDFFFQAHFPEVRKKFAPGMDATARMGLLFDYVERDQVLLRLRQGYAAAMQRHTHLLRYRD